MLTLRSHSPFASVIAVPRLVPLTEIFTICWFNGKPVSFLVRLPATRNICPGSTELGAVIVRVVPTSARVTVIFLVAWDPRSRTICTSLILYRTIKKGNYLEEVS